MMMASLLVLSSGVVEAGIHEKRLIEAGHN